jgi:hypothetical protein
MVIYARAIYTACDVPDSGEPGRAGLVKIWWQATIFPLKIAVP